MSADALKRHSHRDYFPVPDKGERAQGGEPSSAAQEECVTSYKEKKFKRKMKAHQAEEEEGSQLIPKRRDYSYDNMV